MRSVLYVRSAMYSHVLVRCCEFVAAHRRRGPAHLPTRKKPAIGLGRLSRGSYARRGRCHVSSASSVSAGPRRRWAGLGPGVCSHSLASSVSSHAMGSTRRAARAAMALRWRDAPNVTGSGQFACLHRRPNQLHIAASASVPDLSDVDHRKDRDHVSSALTRFLAIGRGEPWVVEKRGGIRMRFEPGAASRVQCHRASPS